VKICAAVAIFIYSWAFNKRCNTMSYWVKINSVGAFLSFQPAFSREISEFGSSQMFASKKFERKKSSCKAVQIVQQK
jgi:hypothetical protein